MSVPTMSAGSRSGVNCTRLKLAWIADASVRTASVFAIAPWIFACTSFGVPAGTSSPNQDTCSKPGKVSESVATSGSTAMRCLPPTAIAFTLPD